MASLRAEIHEQIKEYDQIINQKINSSMKQAMTIVLKKLDDLLH